MLTGTGAWLSCAGIGLENVVQLLQPGKVLLIGARPGMGKSTFLHNLLEHLPNQSAIPVTYYISKTPNVPRIYHLKRIIRNVSRLISVLVIDEIQLVKYSCANKKGTAINLRNFLKYLKNVACELSVPVVLLAKWPRLCEERIDHKPQVDDFSVTDVTSDDFDAVLLLYRNSYYYWDNDTTPLQNASYDDMEMFVVSKC